MSQYGNYKCKEFEEYCKQKDEQKRTAQLVGGGILAFLIILALIMSGCRAKQPIVVEKEKVVYVYSDSTIIHDSTIYVPIEVYRDYSSLLDTLRLSTSLAESWSAVDTNNMLLVGEIKNLKAVQVKYIEVEKVVRNDSIIEKEVPKPYPVVEEKRYIPTFAWICIVWAAISIVLLGLWLYVKFWKP